MITGCVDLGRETFGGSSMHRAARLVKIKRWLLAAILARVSIVEAKLAVSTSVEFT